MCIWFYSCIFASEKETNNKLNPKTRKGTKIMTITGELKNLEKVQSRCIRFSKYLEKHHKGRYDDLMRKLACVIGTIEDTLNFDEV